MTPADHVRSIALFNEKNPQPNVAVFHLGPRRPRPGRDRMRLADLADGHRRRAAQRRHLLVRHGGRDRHAGGLRGELSDGAALIKLPETAHRAR